uniref:IPD083Gb n=1 Tax=Adiantum raddianum TaxID=32168 RepID=A0A3S6ZRI1_ADIRA|nr:IPD083Gb [Adiantum raddianum]
MDVDYAADAMDVDYAEIYKEVNQVTRPVPTRVCSEVMSIQRMYFQLDDLDAKLLRNTEVVKRLYVFADVVEMVGQSVELAASVEVVILCRIFKTTRSDAVLRFLSLTSRLECDATPVYASANVVSHFFVRPRPGAADPRLLITIHATQLVAPARTQLRVQRPNVVLHRAQFWALEEIFMPGGVSTGATQPVLRPAVTQDGAMEWRISPYVAGGALAARSFHFTHPHVYRTSQDYLGFTGIFIPEPIPYDLLTNSNIWLGMECTTLICELIDKYQRQATQTVEAAHHHVAWLDKQLLSMGNRITSSNIPKKNVQQIETLHFRVQSLLKIYRRTANGVDAPLIVPSLQYDVYDRIINLMTRAAESYDNDFKQLNLFIQQNEILGSFLLDQNRAFAQKERDMENHHLQLVTLQGHELQATGDKLQALNRQLAEQSEAMDQAKADMDAGIKEYRDAMIANAIFSVFKAIAALCLAAATGGAAAGAAAGAAVDTAAQLSELARVLQSVVKLLKRIENVVKTINAITAFLTELESLNQLIELPEMPEMPTDADWSIFENEIEAVAEGMPTEISEVPAWKAKCKNVAAVGREIITTVAHVEKLQYEISVSKMLQDIAQQQAERLEGLRIEDLDNYLEMATELDMRTNRILMGLLDMLSLQTGALSYHYLLRPRPFTGWVRMETVWRTLLQNESDKLVAIAALGAPQEFSRSYVVENIPVSLLKEGADWIFDIPVHDPVFPSLWSSVRIDYVEMKFPPDTTHLPTTKGGKVYFLLQAARFFHDRLQEDEVLHYQAAVPLVYQYAYHVESGETTLSNRPPQASSALYMRMTPFTRWRLRLSASAPENEGLEFPTATTEDATTEIAITFFVTARRRISTRVDSSSTT